MSPLHWPGKTVRLERHSLLDFRNRSNSPHVSAAELYHDNSKLFPHILPELLASSIAAEDIRREFIRRRAAVGGLDGTPALELEDNYRELLTRVARGAEPDLHYALELRIVTGELVGSYEPISDSLQLVKELSARERARLTGAVALMHTSAPAGDASPLLLIMGSFARNDILFGARGYRRTLLEAGRLAEAIGVQARCLGLEARPVYDFLDRDIDAVMEADGVELGCLVVFELLGSRHVE
jgi:hypothetical protein